MDKLHFDRTDYSVVVKNRAPPPKTWRWEIYRAGKCQSDQAITDLFRKYRGSQGRGGKDALQELLNKLFT